MEKTSQVYQCYLSHSFFVWSQIRGQVGGRIELFFDSFLFDDPAAYAPFTRSFASPSRYMMRLVW